MNQQPSNTVSKQNKLVQLQDYMIRSNPKLQGFDKPITQNNLYSILAQMNPSSNSYDEEIFTELCERVQQDYEDLTINNFLMVFIEAEEILQLKIEHMDSNINTQKGNCEYLKNLIQQLEQQKRQRKQTTTYNFIYMRIFIIIILFILSQVKKSKKLLQYNFFPHIESIELKDLIPAQNSNPEPYLTIKNGNTTKDTSPQYGTNPVFHLNMQIPVHSYLEDLVIKIMDKKRDDQNFLPIEYGTVEIQVDALPFFEKQQVQYQIHKDNEPIESELLINSYNEVNDYDIAIQEMQQRNFNFQQKIDENLEEKEFFQEQLNNLIVPFAQLQRNSQNKNPNLNQQSLNLLNLQQSQQNQQKSQNMGNSKIQNPNQQQQSLQNSNIQNSNFQQSTIQQSNFVQSKIQNQYNPEQTNYSIISEQKFGQIQAMHLDQFDQFSEPPSTLFRKDSPTDMGQIKKQIQKQDEYDNDGQEVIKRHGKKGLHQTQGSKVMQTSNVDQDQGFQSQNRAQQQSKTPVPKENAYEISALTLEQQPPMNQKATKDVDSSYQQYQQSHQQSQQSQNFQQIQENRLSNSNQDYNKDFKPQYQKKQKQEEDDEDDLGKVFELLKRSDHLTAIFIIMLVLNSFYRPCMTDMCIGTGFFMLLYQRQFHGEQAQLKLNILFGSICASFLMDIIWFVIYVSAYNDSSTSVDGGAEGFLRTITLILSFIIFFYKIALGGSYYLLKLHPDNIGLLQYDFDKWLEGTVGDEEDHD